MGDAFCLKWNNHQTTLVSVFDKLFECESLVDCTLAAEGRQLKAHKVVLSACSPYLEELIRNHEDRHPIIIFNNIRYEELKAMLEYMYRGEVNVSQEQLDSFLKVAESLKIKGLTDQGGGHKNNEKEEQRMGKKRRRRASSESTQSEEKEPLKPEPKLEPIDEANSEPIEDLTIEEEDDEYGPPGPGTSQGSFSSQDFNNWQVGGDITSDEVFLAAQQEINNQGNQAPEMKGRKHSGQL
ncbi:protein tramtrack, beta isoform-like [Halyomorpha halys]|uniref:protein tramtrack, beta isoform-like n=1 Tax=Halyomorpha halys TaxID=286706 RepID=UPI0034D37CF6